jgi:hypothetical protein
MTGGCDAPRWTDLIDRGLDGRELAVLLATAGADGEPHLATADRLLPAPDGRIQVSGWICPTTIRNLHENTKLALVVRGDGNSVEVQGSVENIEEDAVLEGSVPDAEGILRVRWILLVRPERFLRFTDGVHSDEPPGA